MNSQIHTGPHLCPSLTRVRALPVVDRGARHNAPQQTVAISAARNAETDSYSGYTANRQKREATRHRKTDNIEYRTIFAGAFMVFFVAAVFERALPSKWVNVHGNPAVRKPLVEQAKEAASISAGYAFMG
jgi:hypothetical protein